MMENKCNKTPNSNNKYLDHVYCHTSENKNYIRANSNSASGGVSGGNAGGSSTTGVDYHALRKENKQLKTMLILHLELIQEQNNQLLGKDKQLHSQREELDGLRAKNTQLEAQVQELQKQLQRQLKRAAASSERSSLPLPPLAKIQCKIEPPVPPLAAVTKTGPHSAPAALAKTGASSPSTANIIGECNGKLISKIILHRVPLPNRSVNTRDTTHSPRSNTTASDTASEETEDVVTKSPANEGDEEDVEEDEDDDEEDEEEEDNDEEEADADGDGEGEEEVSATIAGNTTTEEDSNDTAQPARQRRPLPPLSLTLSRGAKPRPQLLVNTPPNPSTVPGASNTPALQVCVTPPTPSRGKQMPLMLWHAPEMHSESESGSCDSNAEMEQRSTLASSPTTIKASTNTSLKAKSNSRGGSSLGPPLHHHSAAQRHTRIKSRRCAYVLTPQLYCTREWQDDEFLCDYEFIKEEANALHADTPQLEIPKWTEHELTPSYCIEGTEDLCDETFLKRHSKFEVDEKRRKKWDVQQIREQRRIEKLKRRHCKDELQVPQDPKPLLSFYPQADSIQTICFMQELPVQAFGEMIPKLGVSAEFSLPWLELTATPTTSVNTHTSHSSAVVTLITAGAGSGVGAGGSGSGASTAQQNSSFVFLKKRRRQQSSSTQSTNSRQKSVAAAKTNQPAANALNSATALTSNPCNEASTAK